MPIPESKLPLSEQWEQFLSLWLQQKKAMQHSGDVKQYLWFLREAQKEFGLVYAGFTNEPWIALFDTLFKLLSCEIQETILKSNNRMELPKKKPIEQMTNEEVLTAYSAGTKWLLDHQQVAGTEVNELGEKYEDALWEQGLRRIEKLENELIKRNIA